MSYDPNADQQVMGIIEETGVPSPELVAKMKEFTVSPNCIVRGIFLASSEDTPIGYDVNWNKCGHPILAIGKVDENDESEEEHCLWCGDLTDLSMLVDHLSTIYMHVSGGMVSKPETLPSVVIALGDDAETKRTEQAVADALVEIKGKIRGIADLIWQGLGERDEVTKLLYELAGTPPALSA